MKWDAATEQSIRDQARKSGEPLPPSIANKPELLPGLELFYDAFIFLNSCRPIGMAEGAIPWTAMNEYAKARDLDLETRERLFLLVKDMDAAYLEYMDKKRPKK